MKEGSQNNTDRDDDSLQHDERLSADEKLMRGMLRMSRRRADAPDDTDEAWRDFRREVIGKKSRKRSVSLIHMGIATLCGAAAMLAVIFATGGLTMGNPDGKDLPTGDYVALQHSPSPQRISLEEDGKTDELTAGEPISFHKAITAAVNTDISSGGKNRYKKISTPRGMGVKIILPDSSEVWLNADSYIEFPESFRKGSRIVAVNGEAFFKITRDESSPFIVRSQQLEVRVLGTEFNFNNYTPDNTQVALVRGKVEVLPPSGEGQPAILSPGEAAVCDSEGKVSIEKVDTYAVTQWVEGFFYFDEVPLVDVLMELGRWYNLGVVFHNRDAMSKKVHFSAMRTEPAEAAIESLNNLRVARIKINGNDITVN